MGGLAVVPDGVDPADHGVYDILETVPGTHKQYPVTYRSIKERTFVEDLSAAGRVGVYADVPLMFPPPDINGKILAGGVLPKGRTYSQPADLPEQLEKAGVPWAINGMSWTTFRNRPGPYLDEALEVTGKRIRATEWLMDNSEWDLMASVWVSVDRTQHALSNYVSPDHPDMARNSKSATGAKVRDVYKQLDDAIGAFVSRTRPDDLVLFISDHGFQSVTRTIHMDHLLKRFGFLEFSASNVVFGPMQWGPLRKVARKAYDLLGLHGKVSLPQSVNWSKTKAFTTIRSTGEGVSINLAGREPDGIVDPADYEKVRDQVMEALSSFVDPKTGRKPVKAIFRREEVFKGKHADTAPDILMEPAEQYSLTHAKSAIEDADWISGDHRIDGVIVAAGPSVKPFTSQPLLVDLAPTILAALDAPASIEHTGRVLHEVVGSDATVKHAEPSSKPAVGDPRHADRRRGVHGHRHRGRRDGGAPPRPRVSRVRSRALASRPIPSSVSPLAQGRPSRRVKQGSTRRALESTVRRPVPMRSAPGWMLASTR